MNVMIPKGIEASGASPSLETKKFGQNETGENKLNKNEVAGKTKATEKLDAPIALENTKLMPKNGGEWSGERGESAWTPEKDIQPGDRNGTNPEHKTWGQIQDEYHFKEIPFKDGYPDFSKVAKGEVQITDYTDDRSMNFLKADEKLAEVRRQQPEEIAKWRHENNYTWHECQDCKTMQLVPSEVHGNIPHSGGISAYRAQHMAA